MSKSAVDALSSSSNLYGRQPLDVHDMYSSIVGLIGQLKETVRDPAFSEIPAKNKPFHHVVVVGMGSSLIAYRLVESLYGQHFSVPVVVCNSETLPSPIDSSTLVILASHSGTSAEVVACVKQVKKSGASIITMSAGPKLNLLVKKQLLFGYIFDNQHNPCQQPRAAIGYSFGAFVQILQHLKIIPNRLDALLHACNELGESISRKEVIHQAASLSKKLTGKFIEIIGVEHLAGNAELFAKQIQWNSKQNSAYWLLPESLHILPEGISYPVTQKRNRITIILSSNLLRNDGIKQVEILRSYFKDHDHKIEIATIKTKSREADVLYGAIFSSFVSYFLAQYNHVDPTPTPGINFYKDSLQ